MDEGMKEVNQFLKLKLQVRREEEKLDKKKELLARLEERVRDYFLQQETQSVKLKGGTVYLNREIFASVNLDEYPDALKVLKRSELADLVKETVNPQSLRARIKELVPKDAPLDAALKKNLPAGVVRVLKISELVRVRVRKNT